MLCAVSLIVSRFTHEPLWDLEGKNVENPRDITASATHSDPQFGASRRGKRGLDYYRDNNEGAYR